MHEIQIRRVYDHAAAPASAKRVLVDRVWPRGIAKMELEGAVWLRDVAPSNELRKWFGHDPVRWAEFRRRYFAELDANPAVARLRELVQAGPVTLLYGARDEAHNQAAALRDYLRGERV